MHTKHGLRATWPSQCRTSVLGDGHRSPHLDEMHHDMCRSNALCFAVILVIATVASCSRDTPINNSGKSSSVETPASQIHAQLDSAELQLDGFAISVYPATAYFTTGDGEQKVDCLHHFKVHENQSNERRAFGTAQSTAYIDDDVLSSFSHRVDYSSHNTLPASVSDEAVERIRDHLGQAFSMVEWPKTKE